jgi:hypothetical protein
MAWDWNQGGPRPSAGPDPWRAGGRQDPGPPPAPPGAIAPRATYDGSFVGPLLPPGASTRTGTSAPSALPAPRVTDEVLAIPLGTRALLRQSLDLLTRSDAGLRSASFYIGFMMLVTVGPAIVLLGMSMVSATGVGFDQEASGAWFAWVVLASMPATLGYIAAGTEARSMATAVLGGRVEGRPLRLPESISVARDRFWRILGAQLLVGVVVSMVSGIAQVGVLLVLGPVQVLSSGISLLVSLAVGIPFVYVAAGIVLGEVGVGEAFTRSFRLVGLRRKLAVVVALFGVLSQFIVTFGFSAAADVIGRIVVGSGLVEDFPVPLVVPIAAALTFALGTLTFLVEAIAAAPAVHAFEALTHYTHGLESGRRRPVELRHVWDPWVTPGLAGVAIVAMLALVGGVLTYPG